MDKIDKVIIQRLSVGETQIQIREHMVIKCIEPNSLRLIEKRINALKKEHQAKSTFQLAVKLMRKGELK